MGKRMTTVLVALVVGLFFAGSVSARTAMVPDGTVVSAKVDMEKKTATVTITGLQSTGIEIYSYKGVEKLTGASTSTSTFQMNLREGRRFQIVFEGPKGTAYALLAPGMVNNPWAQELFGKGIGLDCSDPRGCCFMVVAPKK